jgi:hypothetical protein
MNRIHYSWALMDTQTTQGSSRQLLRPYHWQSALRGLLWLKDKERSLSPVLFCLDSEYAANATQGISQVHKNAVLIEKSKQLYLEEARSRAGGFSFTHVPSHCKILGNERADDSELAALGKANLRCTVGRFENCGPPRSARPETSKGPSCSEIEVIIRDFESVPTRRVC